MCHFAVIQHIYLLSLPSIEELKEACDSMHSIMHLGLFKNDEFYTVNIQLSFPVPRYVGKLYLHRTTQLDMKSFSRDLSNLFLISYKIRLL